MTASLLLADLARLGITLQADADRLRYSPRSAVTPDLVARLQTHKAELLAMLLRDPQAPVIGPTDATAVWQAALDLLDGDPLFPPDILADLRATDVQWAPELPASDRTESPRTNAKPNG